MPPFQPAASRRCLAQHRCWKTSLAQRANTGIASPRCRIPSVSNRFVHRFTTNSTRNSSSTSNTSSPATSEDVRALQQELKALRELIQDNRTETDHVRSLAQLVATKTTNLEASLQEMNSHVSKISAIEKLANNFRDTLHNSPALRGVVENLETMVQRSTPYVKHYKYGIASVLGLLGILWKYRVSLLYQRTSEEVADLARRTLEQESLQSSIQETLQTVANSPSTLQTLNDLVQKLLTHERTQQDLVNLLVFAVNTPQVQESLLELLQMVFKDPYLQQLTGEFLLKGLDVENVKEMLNNQTQELVRDTVADHSVQQATAVGLQRTIWYSITPSFLWQFFEQKKTAKGGNDASINEKKNDNQETSSPENDSANTVNGNVQKAVDHQVNNINLPSQ